MYYITLGAGGWYSEQETIQNGNLLFPSSIDATAQAADELLKHTPQSFRISIKNPEQVPFSFSH